MLKLDQTWEFAILDHFDEALERAALRAPGIRTFWASLAGGSGAGAAEPALELLGLPPDDLVRCLAERCQPTAADRRRIADAILVPLQELEQLSAGIHEDVSLIERLLLPWVEQGVIAAEPD